mgnify:CR=1 FL=1
MADVILALKENWNAFWGTGHYEILFLLSLLYILLTDKSVKNKQILFYYPAALLFIILNPLFAWGTRLFFPLEQVYASLFLLIPVHIVIAYVMQSLLERSNRVSGKIALFTGFCILLLLSGSTYYQEGLFSQADNFMKIPNETIAVCSTLSMENETVKVIAPAELLPYIRQYDADVLLCYGSNGNSNDRERTDDLYAQFESPEINVEYVVSEIRDMGCNYVVYYKNDGVVEQFIAQGYQLLGETEHYVILKEM